MKMELFRNSHDALKFAFNFSSEQYGTSAMSQLSGPMASSGKGLVGMDGAGQAGFIMREFDDAFGYRTPNEDKIGRACIVARYSPRYKECPCCRNTMGMQIQEYKEAITILENWSMQWITGISVRQMREVIIRSFYERRVHLMDEADRLNIGKTTAYAQKGAIIKELKKIDSEAQGKIFTRLEKMCGFL